MTDGTATRRPAAVRQRDAAVLGALVGGPKSLVDLTTEVGLKEGQAYGSVWRGRREGLVEKIRVGGRTPLWQLTENGQRHVAEEAQKAAQPAEPEAQPAEG